MDDTSRILQSIAALAADVAVLKSGRSDQVQQAVLPMPAPAGPELKGVGNAAQYKFCVTVQDHLQAALSGFTEDEYGDWQLSSGNAVLVNKVVSDLRNAANLVAQRQKLIRLADRSEHGWAVVPHYLADPLASDEDDEKRMKAAGKAAAAERVKQQQKTASGDVGFYSLWWLL
jgi:regulator of RNase E activity RraB